MDEDIDGWIAGWMMGGWMHGWVHGWIDRELDKQRTTTSLVNKTHACTHTHTDGQATRHNRLTETEQQRYRRQGNRETGKQGDRGTDQHTEPASQTDEQTDKHQHIARQANT